MENKTIKIRVKVTTAKTREGKEFTAYKIVTNDGKLIDLRFKKECKNLPTESGFVWVESSNINKDNKREYPCFWIKKIEKFEPRTISTNVDKFLEDIEVE